MKINRGYNKLTYHYFSVAPLSHFLNNNIIIITYILFFPWTIIAYKEKLMSEPEGRAASMIDDCPPFGVELCSFGSCSEGFCTGNYPDCRCS